METWKDIENYEGLYQVSDKGRIKSFRKSTKLFCVDEYILKPTLSNNGYYQVTLYDNAKRKKFLVHRLVASTFIDNPQNLKYVNHKDENTLNNNADNLEWCDMAYNNNYGTAKLRAMLTTSTPVSQYLLSGQKIATYASASIAAKINGINKSVIRQCCRGETLSCAGYRWKYVDCI